MSKFDKEIQRLKSIPKDLTYDEVKNLLNKLGFYEDNKGRTSGSRVVFRKESDITKRIMLHKPHPKNILKEYQVKIILNKLREMEEI